MKAIRPHSPNHLSITYHPQASPQASSLKPHASPPPPSPLTTTHLALPNRKSKSPSRARTPHAHSTETRPSSPPPPPTPQHNNSPPSLERGRALAGRDLCTQASRHGSGPIGSPCGPVVLCAGWASACGVCVQALGYKEDRGRALVLTEAGEVSWVWELGRGIGEQGWLGGGRGNGQGGFRRMKVAQYWLWRMAAIWGFVGVSQGWQLLVEVSWLLSVGVIAEFCWAVGLWRGVLCVRDRCSVCSTCRVRSFGLR